jgi:hypothetical protein
MRSPFYSLQHFSTVYIYYNRRCPTSSSTAVGYGVGLACDRVRIQHIFIFMMVFQAIGIAAV